MSSEVICFTVDLGPQKGLYDGIHVAKGLKKSLSRSSVRQDRIEQPGSRGLPSGYGLSVNGSKSMDSLIWFLCPAGGGEL